MSKDKDKNRNMLFWGWLGLIIAIYLIMVILGAALGRAISYFLGTYK